MIETIIATAALIALIVIAIAMRFILTPKINKLKQMERESADILKWCSEQIDALEKSK